MDDDSCFFNMFMDIMAQLDAGDPKDRVRPMNRNPHNESDSAGGGIQQQKYYRKEVIAHGRNTKKEIRSRRIC